MSQRGLNHQFLNDRVLNYRGLNHPVLSSHFSDLIVRVICWTFIHSLWIGLIIAVLAALVITCFPKTHARVRYNLLCGLLLLFTGLVFRQLGINYTAPQNITFINSPLTAGAATINYFDHLIRMINGHATIICGVWLFFFVLKLTQLGRQLVYIKHLRNDGLMAVSETLTATCAALAEKMGIRHAVQLMESQLVNVPVTIGFLKPVMLLPVGIVLQLSTEQVEAILYHELAHILRRDYLVNMLQRFIEALFFFNPAIWWLGTLIREEREMCCDDLVLDHVPQKIRYLEALMAFQGYESQPTNYAMGLSFHRNQLMNRLRRMIKQEKQQLTITEKMLLLLGICLFAAFMLATSLPYNVKKNKVVISNTLITSPGEIHTYTDDHVHVLSRQIPAPARLTKSNKRGEDLELLKSNRPGDYFADTVVNKPVLIANVVSAPTTVVTNTATVTNTTVATNTTVVNNTTVMNNLIIKK